MISARAAELARIRPRDLVHLPMTHTTALALTRLPYTPGVHFSERVARARLSVVDLGEAVDLVLALAANRPPADHWGFLGLIDPGILRDTYYVVLETVLEELTLPAGGDFLRVIVDAAADAGTSGALREAVAELVRGGGSQWRAVATLVSLADPDAPDA